MNLADLLSPDCIIAPLAAKDKRGVIDELVDAMARSGKVHDAKALKDAVWQREQTRTTGIGQGLAIPHGKAAGLAGLALAVGKPGEPMNFEAIDGKPVKLVVMLASPPDRINDHIQVLASISRLMLKDAFRERVYGASSAAEIYELLRTGDVAPVR